MSWERNRLYSWSRRLFRLFLLLQRPRSTHEMCTKYALEHLRSSVLANSNRQLSIRWRGRRTWVLSWSRHQSDSPSRIVHSIHSLHQRSWHGSRLSTIHGIFSRNKNMRSPNGRTMLYKSRSNFISNDWNMSINQIHSRYRFSTEFRRLRVLLSLPAQRRNRVDEMWKRLPLECKQAEVHDSGSSPLQSIIFLWRKNFVINIYFCH